MMYRMQTDDVRDSPQGSHMQSDDVIKGSPQFGNSLSESVKWQFEEGVFSHNKANRETYDRETYDKSWLASGGLSSNTVYIDRILNII